jgi:hypothetical protein
VAPIVVSAEGRWMRAIYADELKRLDAYARERRSA